jgi:hyperosmotically inducible periplasmic protein
MQAFGQRTITAISALAMLLALGGCNRPDREQALDAAARANAQKSGDQTQRMGAAAASKPDDATITSKVKAAIAADKDLGTSQIEVRTSSGVVTLSGPAPSARASDRATEIARDIDGVTSVKNRLTIKAG